MKNVPLDNNTEIVAAGTEFFIDNIAGDGATWNPIILPDEIKRVAVSCRTGNTNVYTHFDDPAEFHFSQKLVPGVDWVHVQALEMSIFQDSADVLGYVRSAAGTYVSVVGLK